jgi:hypothetical protein
MKTDSNATITIAVSGTLTIARQDVDLLLKGIIGQLRNDEPRDAQPKVEAAQPKPTAEDFGPPQRLAFSMKETADILGVSSISVWRLLKRGLLKSSNALRRKIISRVEIERFLKETSRTIY